MPDDVRDALERFQQFLGGFGAGELIDPNSGFTVADGMLLVGEVELAARQHRASDEDRID